LYVFLCGSPKAFWFLACVLYSVHVQERTERLLSKLLFWSLLLWGGFTTLYFLGSHLTQIFPDGVARALAEERSSIINQGLRALFVLTFRAHGSVLLIPGLLLVVLMISLRWWRVRLPVVTMTPLRALGGFFLLLFLIFLTVFSTDLFGQPRSLIFRPSPKVYIGAGEEALSTLELNVREMGERGCIHGESGGAVLGRFAWMCLVTSFVTRVILPVILLLFLCIDMLILGMALLRGLRYRPPPHLLTACFALLLGNMGFIVILWSFAALWMSGRVSTLLTVLFPLLLLPFLKGPVRAFLTARWSLRLSLESLLGLFLIALLTLNLLTVLRPFPIGWDDLTAYLYAPKLLAEYGGIVPGMERLQWEHLVSIPFLLFGIGSPLAVQVAQAVMFFGSALATFLIFAFSRAFLPGASAVVAALLYASLPMVGHGMFTELKVDGALFAISVGSLIALFLAFQERKSSIRWLALAGVLMGFAFSVKFTAMFAISLIFAVISYHSLGSLGAIGVSLLPLGAFAVFSGKHVGLGSNFAFLPQAGFSERLLMLFGILLILIGLLLLVFQIVRRGKQGQRFLLSIGIMFASAFVVVAPWMGRNLVSWWEFSLVRMLHGRNSISPFITQHSFGDGEAPASVRGLPSELALDEGHPACTGTAMQESFARYQQPWHGLKTFLVSPWDLVMNTHLRGFYVTLSPLLLLLPLIVFLPDFWRRRWMQGLAWGTLLVILEWLAVSQGVPWYGAIAFLLVAIFMGILCHLESGPLRYVSGFLVTVALLSAFAMRFAQFDSRREGYEYILGRTSARAAEELTFPGFQMVAENVQTLRARHPERPLLYRVGTALPYFLEKSLEVIGRDDGRLDFFTCLNQEGDHTLTLQRLQQLGFSSVIFDVRVAEIEPEPEGTLHQKVAAFQSFLRDPKLGIDLVVDRPEWGYVFAVLP
jgi:hypothetical protein